MRPLNFPVIIVGQSETRVDSQEDLEKLLNAWANGSYHRDKGHPFAYRIAELREDIVLKIEDKQILEPKTVKAVSIESKDMML